MKPILNFLANRRENWDNEKSFLSLELLVVILVFLVVMWTDAKSAVYTDRTTFESLGSFSIDDYSHPDYTHGDEDYELNDKFSDEHMSSIMGTTTYKGTGHWLNPHATAIYMLYEEDEFGNLFESTNRYYCAGCNGSFELSWDNVSAVGIDIASNYSDNPYHAWVTYGDGSNENFALPLEERAHITTIFWGLTDERGIESIHFGNPFGEITTKGSFAIDNLTTGTITAMPIPAATWLFGTALIGFVGVARRIHG